MAMKLVIDTDVGSDDAIALVLCAAGELLGRVEILGVTCVHGNTALDNVCVNTLKTLQTIHRLRIPVYRGVADSLVETFERAANVHGGDGFGDFIYPDPPDVDALMQKEHAVNFLTRIARQHQDVTVLALGPLTNIALAIRMDPAFSSNVKHILVMGGNMEGMGNITAGAEFNFRCDPEAAHVTIHSMKCPITIFPFETAYRYAAIPYEWRKGVLGAVGTPQSELLNKVERVMLECEMYGRWGRCDPIAAAIVMVPEVATTVDRRYVTVELHGSATRGALVVDHLDKMGQQPNARVVSRINVELYKEMLLQAFRMDFSPVNVSKKRVV